MMMTPPRLKRVAQNEQGYSLVILGGSFMALLSASMLAIDVGMLMHARAQAQASADAGALAGATALVFNSFTDHSESGPAVRGAINTAQANRVVGAQPSVIPADVVFPPNPVTGQSDLVQVTVHRTAARQNPVVRLITSDSGLGGAPLTLTASAQMRNEAQ